MILLPFKLKNKMEREHGLPFLTTGEAVIPKIFGLTEDL